MTLALLLVEYHPMTWRSSCTWLALELGYDEDHGSRTRLVPILRGVEAGGVFPEDIMGAVRAQVPGASTEKIDACLRPQLSGVIASFSAAVKYEELRLAELKRLEAQVGTNRHCSPRFCLPVKPVDVG